MPVVLYYRVAWQTTQQIEYARIDEVTNFVQGIRLSYIRGLPYHDSGLSPWWVPIAICKTSFTNTAPISGRLLHFRNILTSILGF
jgi:hypothetical protein